MKQVIYETRGRAREYSELALNLFSFCEHGCIYCYVPNVLHKTKERFLEPASPQVTLGDIQFSAAKRAEAGDKRRVLLCFTCDPYQPIEQKTKLTRSAIQILHDASIGVIILTKGGWRSTRDFDLLGPQDAYATTLTLTSAGASLHWEPGAAVPIERIKCLEEAHSRGIETWVSFEPVIDPEETFRLLDLTNAVVGHYKVGIMNYHPQGKSIDWKAFGFQMKRIMDAKGIYYYFKKDLLRKMGIPPANFKQTWVCR